MSKKGEGEKRENGKDRAKGEREGLGPRGDDGGEERGPGEVGEMREEEGDGTGEGRKEGG